MQRSVVRAHPALLERVHLEIETKEYGHRSQSRNHARLHRVQAAQLSDAEVQAELPGPGRVQEVLPLVQPAHSASGDSLTLGVWRGRRVKNGARAARSSRRAPRAVTL